jgi:hypothetical protein
MKHLAAIQIEFLKAAAQQWDDLSLEDQRNYLQRHPLSRRKLTGQSMGKKKMFDMNDPDFAKRYSEGDLTQEEMDQA